MVVRPDTPELAPGSGFIVEGEFDRTRAALLQETGRDLKVETGQAWSAAEEKPVQEKIKARMQEEYAARDARKEELKAQYDSQFGKEDEEVQELKGKVNDQYEMVAKWKDRLKKLPWYSSLEKRTHITGIQGELIQKS